MRHFLSQNLLLRSNKELEEGKELPPINKAFVKRLAASYKEVKTKKTKEIEEEAKNEIGLDLGSDDYEEVIFDQEPIQIDIMDIFKKLEKELPKLPDEIQMYMIETLVISISIPQNPPPYTKPPIQIGPPIPKPKEKGPAARKPPPKPPKKKDKDEKPIKWAGMPEQRPQMAMENVLDVRKALEEQDAQDDDYSGTMSNIDVAPELIKEVHIGINQLTFLRSCTHLRCL